MSSDVLKSRNFLIAAVAVVVILLGGSFFLFKGSGSAPIPQETIGEEPIPTISPDELGVKLEAEVSENAVYLTVGNTQGIEEMDYEASYMAADVPRGVIGKVNLNRKPAKEKIYLGTCSDVCHPDKDISNIKVILKIIKNDGKVYQSESSLDKFE